VCERIKTGNDNVFDLQVVDLQRREAANGSTTGNRQ
jgi:hypothetical protein